MTITPNRREFLAGTGTLLLTGPTMPATAVSPAGVSVQGLRTECVEFPIIGVEATRPMLSWRIEADRRNVRQSAYRIEVASSAEALAAGHADLWDSGRVASDMNVGIRYDGTALVSRQRCYWRVRIWDERGVASPPSPAAWWEMGLLHPTEWSAQWIWSSRKGINNLTLRLVRCKHRVTIMPINGIRRLHHAYSPPALYRRSPKLTQAWPRSSRRQAQAQPAR